MGLLYLTLLLAPKLLIRDPVFVDPTICIIKEILFVLAAHSLGLLVRAVCKSI